MIKSSRRRSTHAFGVALGSTSIGEVKRFVVQLEYRVDAEQDTWVTVVRYDHDAKGSAEATHDVTEDGLHIDIYRDGKKVDSHELTLPLSANDALRRPFGRAP